MLLLRKNILNIKILYNFSRHSSYKPVNYCLESVKKNDYENYICSLLLKENARTTAFAIRGFNVEIGRAVEQVTQPQLAVMRLKFWEDAIERCFKADNRSVPEHPIAIELANVINKAKLSKRYFMNMIRVRSDNAAQNIFKNLDSMEKYNEGVVSNIYYLILEGAGIKNIHADHAASHLGKAQGILQQLRSLPHAKSINFIAIPQDILIKHNLSFEDVFRGQSDEPIKESVFEVASRAYQHLVKAEKLIEKLPKEAKTVLLSSVPVRDYLKRLERCNYNIYDVRLQRRPFTWLLKLWFRSIKS